MIDSIIGERIIKAPLKLKNEDDEILCIVYPQRKTVILLDIDGHEHIYAVPLGVRRMRAPSVLTKDIPSNSSRGEAK